jgi:hypothetical protein
MLCLKKKFRRKNGENIGAFASNCQIKKNLIQNMTIFTKDEIFGENRRKE